jgi:hypothetical protein
LRYKKCYVNGRRIEWDFWNIGWSREAARFNAIAILTNLAAVEKNRLIMLSEPGLVNNIARVIHNERSDVARQCSALSIMNLSNGDREHVPELAGNDLLLESIIKITKEGAPETKRNAVIALFNVVSFVITEFKHLLR